MIPAIDRLQCLMDACLSRVDKENIPLVEAISARLPETIHALADLAVSNDVSKSMRLRASALLFAAWTRVTRLEDKADERETVKERAKARREAAKARNQRLKNEAIEAKRIADKKTAVKSRRLAEALSQVAKIGENTDGN